MEDGYSVDHVKMYNRTIVVLTVLTAVEFGLAYLVKPGGDSEPTLGIEVGLTLLCALAAWKAILVGRVFMHLKFDPKVLSLLAVCPVILGAPLIVVGPYDAIYGGAF